MDNIRRPRPYLFAIICLFVFSSCKKKPAQVTRSYYFWRNDDGTSDTEENFIKQHGIRKLYTRLMDVDWSEVYGPIPVSTTYITAINEQLNIYDSLSLEMVPVVFITNKTFERIDTADIPLLAKRLVRRCLPD